MIIQLISLRPFKSMYSNGSIKRLQFRDIETKVTYTGYLDPKNAELFNTVFPTLKVGALYVGYTHPKRQSINMRKLTLSAVQPVISVQLAFDL